MTLVSNLGEREIIRRFILPIIGEYNKEYLEDDCAVIPIDREKSILVSIDKGPRNPFQRILGVGTLSDLGLFYITLNVSDIAAMGGTPIGMVTALSLKPSFDEESLKELLNGIQAGIKEYSVPLLGGDTKEGEKLDLTITILGIAHPDFILSRGGAKVGDSIFVSGKLGVALRSVLEAAYAYSQHRKNVPLRLPHAKLELGQALAKTKLCTSCMDMSDGICSSASQLAHINDVTFHLDSNKIPIVQPHRKGIEKERWFRFVTSVGSDFELLFTLDSSLKPQELEEKFGVFHVGFVEASESERPLKLSGLEHLDLDSPWEHFISVNRIEEELRRLV